MIMDFIVQYWLEFLFGVVVALLGYLVHKIKRYYKTLETSVEGVRILLKTKIIEEYHQIKKENVATMYQKQNLANLYQEYQKFGEDNFIEDMMQELDKIPITKC